MAARSRFVVWCSCNGTEGEHLAGPWCASAESAAAVPEPIVSRPHAAGSASSHRTPRTFPIATPLGLTSRFVSR